ncbi:NAD(P)/FAD-dependent oxidoreductase [Niveispirillum fermenti]|uniref:NAD(P)/FAD-dependent oxidoreductase n=1 Tax=Niveispirillum fermenti TaxID=1233113 RepID=UPI003A8590D2
MEQVQDPVIIAGAGQAGAQLAQSLRQGGFKGTITVIGEEAFPPYERPPLSKDYLAGKRDAARLFLRKPEFWAERQVDMRLGQRVSAVDAAARSVTLQSGETLPYGWLVWATGGRPRQLSCEGAGLAGIHYVRSIADIDRMKADLTEPGRRIVIVGGGYIGLEAAAVLRSFGHGVTVLEMQDRLLARVTSPTVSRFFRNLHEGHGVKVMLSTGVTGLTGVDGRVTGVALSDGSTLPADLVVVGVGIIPNVEPLAAAGLPCPNGVAVDEFCRSSDPHILAIGDCALHPNGFADAHIRLESVQNAIDQAKVAADVILGNPKPYTAMPWFWSDQYEVKMQTAGLSIGHDQVVVRGTEGKLPFSVAYLKQGKLIALDCLGSPKDFMQCRALVTARAAVDPEKLADTGIDLKSLMAAAAPAPAPAE